MEINHLLKVVMKMKNWTGHEVKSKGLLKIALEGRIEASLNEN